MSTENKLKAVAVVGPTASGKTALAVELAERLGGEVVSCDSMQIYRGMDIGTAKPTPAETRGIPHHMIDIADIGESYSCAAFAADALRCAEEITARGKLPILCGGTGLYLDALLTGNEFAELETPPGLREELSARDPGELYAELVAVDPGSAEKIHPNNVKRVVRALEIYRVTGETKTELDRRSRLGGGRFDSKIIGLDFSDRALLYERINRRVDAMLADGLVEEVRRLAPALRGAPTASQAIGYKELLRYIDGECTLPEAAEEIKLSTRRYAKRQLTWFRRDPEIKWVMADGLAADKQKYVNIILTLLTF